MRGPQDERIVAVEEPDPELAAARVPGGKALVRLLQLLEARGYESLAGAAIETALPADARDLFYSRAERFTSSPTRRVARRGTSGERPAPRRGAARGASGEEPATEAVAEAIAREHIAAVQQPGPPTGTGPQWRSLGPATIPNGQTYNLSLIHI